jgi:hypothetical protein
MLAAGSRQNASQGAPVMRDGYSQIVVDGQHVTTMGISLDAQQPRYSRDAIAEFELITNRFDATQGRSAGVIVNAITKSGTNQHAGTFSSFFRNDRFNAEDFIQGRVLPYSNQQYSGTFGGPIRRDRIHFFTSYEYEREPRTITFNSPFPAFNIDQPVTQRQHMFLGRLDAQFSPNTRMTVRGQRWNRTFFSGGGATNHPANTQEQVRYTNQLQGTLTHVFSPQAVNEIRVGYATWDRTNTPFLRWAGGDFPGCGRQEGTDPNFPVTSCFLSPGAPIGLQLRGYNIGTPSPQRLWFDYPISLRDDFTFSFAKGGRHDVRLGVDYVYHTVRLITCNGCGGRMLVRGGPVPRNIAEIIPVWNDASTWNYAALSPIAQRTTINVSNNRFERGMNQHLVAGWYQDDWRMTSRLTLNLGVRYDLITGHHSERITLLPWLPGNLPHDTNNIAPRLGLAYSLNDRTVIRGGYGLFYAQHSGDTAQQTQLLVVGTLTATTNDGRPTYAADPFNGPRPTFDFVKAQACGASPFPGCVRESFSQEINHPWREDQHSHQASIGFQRQLATAMSLEMNYVYTGGRHEEAQGTGGNVNANLSYNPETGANYPFSDLSRRPFPGFGVVPLRLVEGWSNYHALETTFTKRLSSRWQATATYTYAQFRDADPLPWQYFLGSNGVVDRRPVGFNTVPDLGGEYTLAETDQRHRAVFNGIWEVGYGFQLSGIYFYGSGERLSTTSGVDVRDRQVGPERVTPDGSILPRNDFVGDPLHRVDLRLQRRFRLGGNRSLDGMVEVFNLFNHENFGSYVTNVANANFGRPTANENIVYQPRSVQFGLRFAF